MMNCTFPGSLTQRATRLKLGVLGPNHNSFIHDIETKAAYNTHNWTVKVSHTRLSYCHRGQGAAAVRCFGFYAFRVLCKSGASCGAGGSGALCNVRLDSYTYHFEVCLRHWCYWYIRMHMG